VRHEEERKTTTKKQKPKEKKTKMSKKKSGTLLTSLMYVSLARASQAALVMKSPPANAGDVRAAGSIPGSGSSPAEGNANPLWDPCLENPMDRGAWRATVHRVTKSQTQMSVHVCACTHTHRQTRQTKGHGSFLGSRGLWFQAVDTFLKPYIYVYIFSKLCNL